jgi:hypothetical protein
MTAPWQDSVTGKWHAVDHRGVMVGPFQTKQQAQEKN